MLVEADAVVAEPVKLLPSVKMLRVGLHRDFRIEIIFA